MFTITSTRIVGLIAVVCAAIVAPQALAMPIIDSQDATPTIIAPPGDNQGYDMSSLDPSVLNGIQGHQQQQGAYSQAAPKSSTATTFVDNPLGDLKSGRVVFTAATHKNVKAATFVYTPTNPGWGAAATAAKESAAALAVKTATGGLPRPGLVDLGCEWWS